MNKVIVIVAMLFLSGCATHSLVKPGEVTVGALTFQTPGEWAKRTVAGETIWTYDGELLNRIAIGEIKDGESVLNGTLAKKNSGFSYDAQSTLEETLEQYMDALETTGLANVELETSQPRYVGTHDALDFEFHFANENNLRYRLTGTFIQEEESILRIICHAPEEYYFPKFEPLFREILASVRIR